MRTAGARAAAGVLWVTLGLWASGSAPAEAAPAGSPPAKTVSAAPADVPSDPAQAADKAEAEAAAAQQAAASLEAQVIELRRSLESLELERAAFDDLRRRLDELDARTAEGEHRDGAQPEVPAGDERSLWFRDTGFGIRSPDNRFALRPHARVQALYTGAVAKAGPADAAAADESTFGLAHAEVILEGHAVSPSFEYRLQVDGATPQILEDAFVQWRFLRNMALRAGQFKAPFGRQNLTWTAELEFVDVSTATAAFAPGWDLGTMVVGAAIPGRLEYQLAVMNGAGPNVANDNINLAYFARVVASPFGPVPASEGDVEWHERPGLAVGVAGFYNLVPTDIVARFQGDPSVTNVTDDVNADHRKDNVAIWQGGLELKAVWRGAALQAEGFSRREDPGSAGPSSRQYWGGYVQASYFILPHRLQVGGRIGRTDLPLYGATWAERLQRGTRTDEQSAEISGYFAGHRAKAQVDYAHLAADGTSAPSVHRVRAAVQLAF